MIEFPDFHVAPSTRCGVLPDRAAEAFAEALVSIELLVRDQVEAARARSAAEIERGMLRQLERAFREIPRLAPEYDFFTARAQGAEAMGTSEEDGPRESLVVPLSGAAHPTDTEPEARTAAGNGCEAEEPAQLFMGGRLASLRIVPGEAQVERFGAKRFRADARDENGFGIRRPLDIRWEIDSPLGRLEPDSGPMTTFLAGADTGKAQLTATVTEGGEQIEALAIVHVVELLDASRTGMPEPSFVEDPTGNWRSRMRGSHWEVNRAHPTFTPPPKVPAGNCATLPRCSPKRSSSTPSRRPTLNRSLNVWSKS